MDLALAIGGCTVDELCRRMSEQELREWRAYANLKRLPDRRMELYLARLAQMQSDGKLSLDKFLMFEKPPVEEEDEPMTAEEADRAMSSMLGGAKVIDMTKMKEPQWLNR